MAAGSTDSFTATPQTLGCFNTVDLLKTAQEKLWSAGVIATASTGCFWDDDEPEEKVKKQINCLKRKFHSGRQLLIKYLPRDVTEEDVRELLADFPVQAVVLHTGAGSGSARVALEDPEMLEDWDRERVFVLRGQRVPVAPAPTEMMLCVARLPPAFSEAQFAALVRSYGEVRRSFLMLSERTGISKGYGFVEYTMKETAMQAKSLLDGRQLDGFTLCCDWLDSSHVTFESLHSKCLYVDRLPQNFRDMGEFRKVFSSVVNPPYCQIALRNGCPQDWGLVEFSSADDAELTYSAVEKVTLRGQSIRVSFYIPGVRAINLYLKLLNDSGNKGRGALLPDPPAPAVFQKLQNLAKQNPIFAQNLQNIILTQIQNIPQKAETGGNGMKATTVSVNGNTQTAHSAPSSSSSSSSSSISIPPPRKVNSAPPTGACPSGGKPSPIPGSNGNTQAALVVLLAAQMQMQMGNTPPSLLGNPQMLATLQNLIKQGGNNGPPPASFTPGQFQQAQQAVAAAAAAAPPSVDNLQCNKNGMNGMNNMSGIKNGYHKPANMPKVPLLPSPTTGVSPPPREVSPLESHLAANVSDAATVAAISNFWNGLLGGQIHTPPSLSPQQLEQLLAPKPQLPEKIVYSSKPPPELFAAPPQSPVDFQHNLGLILSNAHNLNALLGTLVPPNFAAAAAAAQQQQQQQRPPAPAEAAWGLPPSPPPPPAAWVPPLGSPLRPWAGSQFSTPATSPIVFAGCHGLWAPAPQPPVTPVGQKRKYNHILPSPEPSPEGNYIGQHSQGLGGHYADSYFKRKKKH